MELLLPLAFLTGSDTIMDWTGVQRVCTVEMFLKTGESVIATQRAFGTNFVFLWNNAVTPAIFYREQYQSDVT